MAMAAASSMQEATPKKEGSRIFADVGFFFSSSLQYLCVLLVKNRIFFGTMQEIP